MRIDVTHLRGLQQRGDSRPGPTATMRPSEERILPRNCLRPYCPLDNVGVDLDAAITQEALESCAPGRSIAD